MRQLNFTASVGQMVESRSSIPLQGGRKTQRGSSISPEKGGSEKCLVDRRGCFNGGACGPRRSMIVKGLGE